MLEVIGEPKGRCGQQERLKWRELCGRYEISVSVRVDRHIFLFWTVLVTLKTGFPERR